MENTEETPTKRRKTENGYIPSQSQEEKTQELPEGLETVPTLPVADLKGPKTPPRFQAEEDDDVLETIPFSVKETPLQRASSPLQSSYVTQPTQIVGQQPRSISPELPRSVVQVAASSPASASPNQPERPIGGTIAQRMAPPGTSYRPPVAAGPLPTRRSPLKPAVVEILSDDEGPVYVGGSSDDEKYNRDIKPTLVKSGSNHSNGVQSTQSSFGGTLEKWRHRDSSEAAAKQPYSRESIMSRSADTLASAYGSISRPPRPPPKQTSVAKALPVQDMDLLDIQDYGMRQKVEEMRLILPKYSIRDSYDALVRKKGSVDDALDFLATRETPPQEAATLGSSEDETTSQHQPRKQTAKQKVNTKQTIQQKYAAKSANRSGQIRSEKADESSTDAVKPRRRLQQGRRNRSPASSPPPAPAKAERKVRSRTPVSVGDDSEASEEPVPDPLLEGSLLHFFNTCSVEGLVDLASTSKENAQYLLSERPFKTLRQVRSVVKAPAIKTGAKRKSNAQPIGERIVDTCEDMWTGYQAVDQLVQDCEGLGKPLIEEMKKWGVSVFGSSTDGELEVVSFEDNKSESSAKDSGIGTPRSSDVSGDEGGPGLKSMAKRRASKGSFFPQPASLASDVVLKDYQVVGINWLSLLFGKGMSCILADDMGLGKTCQVISFLAHLKETGVRGPHLIVVPSSVLENWLREFSTFCPDMSVMPYHGGKNERPELQQDIIDDEPDVVVTTYNIAKKPEDRSFLRKSLRPTCCIFDEGHMLKNPNSQQYKELMRIDCKFRLLLTGTPLQNNLAELIALLGFLMPNMFREHHEELKAIFNQRATTADTDEQQQALLSAQRIVRAKSMMTPFILRRKKHQVLKDIPAKHRRVDYCTMSEAQQANYTSIMDKYRDILRRQKAKERIPPSERSNVMMEMRKAAIHPLLFRRHYTDATLRKMAKACKAEDMFAASDVNLIYEDLEFASDMELHRWCAKYPSVNRFMLKNDEWMDSGKVTALVELLLNWRAKGDRVLVFSQFVMALDILEEVLETISMRFARLDGSVDVNQRQDLIDTFYADQGITVFMLSTRAGGAGVNLACANKVVIFDGSFNPQDDVQAENRAHRVGQTREVEVVRLVTAGSVEEQIYALGQTKLALDERIAGGAGGGDGAAAAAATADDEQAAKKADKAGEKKVDEMLAEHLESVDTAR